MGGYTQNGPIFNLLPKKRLFFVFLKKNIVQLLASFWHIWRKCCCHFFAAMTASLKRRVARVSRSQTCAWPQLNRKRNILTLNVEHWTQWTASLASHPQKNWPPSSLPPFSGTRKYSGNVNFCRSKMLCRKVFEFLTVNGGDRSNIFVLIGQDANAFDALTRIYVKAASSIKIFRNHCII